MARKTRRRRKNKTSKNKSIKSMVRQAANKLAAPVAFWSQLSQKDYEVLNPPSHPLPVLQLTQSGSPQELGL